MTLLLEKLKLKVVRQLDNAVFVTENPDGQCFYWIDHPKAKALIAKQGAHLISFCPAGHGDLLWVSHDSFYSQGKAIRGGVPICWPWFGKQAEPSHGFARISEWSLKSSITDEQAVNLTFELTEQSVADAPFPFHLTYNLKIGSELGLSLETRNKDAKPIAISGALHSYFAVNRSIVKVSGLGQRYLDSLQGGLPCHESNFQLSEATDRIYTDSESKLQLDDGNKQLEISQSGNDSIVVWCISSEQANAMADVHQGAEDEYLCVEAAVTQQSVIIEPGSSHRLKQHIKPLEFTG